MQNIRQTRPCIVHENTCFLPAFFHRFIEDMTPISFKDNTPRYIKTYALVELENGSLERYGLGHVIFLDNADAFAAYDWEELYKQHTERLEKWSERYGAE